jgi:hypothetical protein
MSLDTSPVLRWKIHTTSSSEQKRSREEGEKGTKGHLPAKAADTLLSLKDGSVPSKMDHLPQINIDGDVTWTFKKTTSDQGLSSEGAETKDTIKMVEPIAQRTRCRVKLQRPSEPRMEASILDKMDTEMRQMLIQLIAQNKEQQDQIKTMNLMLEEVLAQQTNIVNKLHATELLCQCGSNGRDSAQISNEDTAKEVVKPCGPRAEPRVIANVCRAAATTTLRAMLPTTDLDGSDVSSFYFDSPIQHERARVCMAAVTPKRQQPEDTSISTDEGVSPFTSGDFASSPRTEQPTDTADENFSPFTSGDFASSPRTEAATDTSPIHVRSDRTTRSEKNVKGKFQVPKAPKKVQDKADKALTYALGKVPDTIHFNRRGKRTTATLYAGNLEFKASTKQLKDELDRVFHKIHVEDVVTPMKNGRSCCYAFVTLSWASASTVNPADICTVFSGMLDVNSRPIYFRELDSKNDTQSSNVSVSSSFMEREQMIEELERNMSINILRLREMEQRGLH